MRRAYLWLALASVVAALGLGLLSRMPRARGADRLAPGRPHAQVALVLREGRVSPALTRVPKGAEVDLEVRNLEPRPVRFALTGYEERVSAAAIAPDSAWRASFVADRPGEEFEWQVDGRAAGRFSVLGSHLEEGHE